MLVKIGYIRIGIGNRSIMNSFNLTGARGGIDMSEISSVKEMILNKAREKSAVISSDKEDSVKNDVMQEARASLSGARNKPFGLLTKITAEPEKTEPIIPSEPEQIHEEIPQLKHNVQSADNSVYTASMRNEVMNAARGQYKKRTSLTESLNFLNTQAAIRLVNKTHSKIT